MGKDWGSKPGSGGATSAQNEAIGRRKRLRQLALETIDLAKDPYIMRNHLGSFDCKLCMTLHNNEANYLAHTQGQRHQTNLARRAAREAPAPQPDHQANVQHRRDPPHRTTVNVGTPELEVTKRFDHRTRQKAVFFQLNYPKIEDNMQPRYRFMSSFEQRVEAPDSKFQYLLFAAEPYETVAFKLPSTDVDISNGNSFSHWDPESKIFTLQVYFKS